MPIPFLSTGFRGSLNIKPGNFNSRGELCRSVRASARIQPYTILLNNKNTNQTVINLKGIAVGNALLDEATTIWGINDNFWTQALNSDETYRGIQVHDFDPCSDYYVENYLNIAEVQKALNANQITHGPIAGTENEIF
ncbi:hypothetical protein CRYUN_Cryun02cG0085400 [Craigia yunnanensis]